MRKTSQDGGDSTSITSGIENEIKKTGAIIRTKRNSIKRKVQSLSHESDDAVIEPLLQKEKHKSDTLNQSAKNNLLSKTKTDIKTEKESDKARLLQKDQINNSLDSDSRKLSVTIIPSASSNTLPKYTGAEAPLHNHMHTNVFNSPNTSKSFVTTKSQAILEIDGSQQTGYSPSTLIFTTAKIHTSDKVKHMEPLQVTPVPILSITEGSILKGPSSNNSGEPSAVVTSNVNAMNANSTNVSEKEHKPKIVSPAAVAIKAPEGKIVDIKGFSDKTILTPDNKKILTGSKLTSNDLKDTNKYVSSEEKKEIDEKLTKISKSEPISDSSSEKIKSSSVLSKSMNAADTTNTGTANYTNKAIVTDKMAQTMKNDKTNVSKISETEKDFNKNMKSIDGQESIRTVGSGSKANVTSKDKSVLNTSDSTKQLQRQKTAIDRDDTKLKSSATNSSPSVFKIATKPQDIVTSVTQNKSPVNDVNSLNNATKLPKASNNVHVTSPFTTINSKLPSSNISLINTTNKPITSNSTKPISPIVTSNNSTILIPTSTAVVSNTSSKAKPLSSNVTLRGNVTKSGDILSSKPSLTSTIANKPLVSKTSAADRISTSVVEASTNNSSVKAPSILTTTATSLSVSTSTAKISTITSKTSPASITNVKTPSVSANATKISALPQTVAKVTSAAISTTKASSVFTNVPNDSSKSMNSTKTPTSSKSTAKAPLASKPSTQGLVLDTTTVKSPSVSTAIKKSADAEKNKTTISKENIKSPITSSSKLTTDTSTSKDQTLKLLPSNKKGEQLRNGNKS